MAKTATDITVDTTLYNAFWNKLQQFKFDLFYYDEHFKRCIFVSRAIKYSIIGATTLATGAWMSWNSITGICIACAIMILLLQAASAVSELLPFEKRKLELRELSAELEALYIDMEADWRKVQALEVTNENIRALMQSYASKQANINKHYFKDDALPQIEKLRVNADNLTEEYFKHFI